ncbi:MAG: pantoate--beta-alanine ligase [Deltaproteobacteria bacterium]|nr:MAG: pantoate--beta-alanine ligase [Deltaproteobacteria bacterium]
MEVVKDPAEMQRKAEGWRREGKVIAFVPTMGYFHEGHLSLMREGRRRGDVLVVSIFVNPTQFGPQEDFERYPRDLQRDLRMAEEVGVDVVFAPEAGAMYPPGFQTYVEVKDLQEHLCGLFRPGHFRGVATVVAKLFNIVKPHVALFGKKDYQQLLIIEQMVRDLNMDVQIVGLPTLREPDGLAASSRNAYLSPEERKAALALSRSLKRAEELFSNGERRTERILGEVRSILEADPLLQVEYVELCDPRTLEGLRGEVGKGALLALAARVGTTRLIDNTILGEVDSAEDNAQGQDPQG